MAPETQITDSCFPPEPAETLSPSVAVSSMSSFCSQHLETTSETIAAARQPAMGQFRSISGSFGDPLPKLHCAYYSTLHNSLAQRRPRVPPGLARKMRPTFGRSLDEPASRVHAQRMPGIHHVAPSFRQSHHEAPHAETHAETDSAACHAGTDDRWRTCGSGG